MPADLKRKNILFLTHAYNSFEKDQIEILAKEFNNVYVLVRYKPIAELYNLVPLKALRMHTKRFAIDLHGTPDNVHVLPVPLFYLPTERAYKNLGELHLRKAIQIIKDKQISFDIIHAHSILTSGYVGVKLKELYNVPCVVTGHGEDVYHYPFVDAEWERLTTGVLNGCDHIITVSERNHECLKKLAVKTEVSVIPNGFNSRLFHPREKQECRTELGLPTDKKIILAVGNVVAVKAHEVLIKAAERLAVHRDDFVCYIVGEGNLRATLSQMVKDKGLAPLIKLVGPKPHREINTWISACDIFTLPSLAEGNPTVMFEALACGRPFIATNVGGIPEVVKDSQYGLLCGPSNDEGLSTILDQALTKTWREDTIMSYAQQFQWETLCQKTQKLYERCLQKRDASAIGSGRSIVA
jgi:glycosyltransferase involved in cell wall biosynthesis